MSELIKVRQIIKLSGWVNGSGWNYKNSVYDNQIIDIDSDDLNNMDWDWWELDEENPPNDDSDTEITVEFYAENADIEEDKPIASHSMWVSEIYKSRQISAAAAALGRKGGKSKSESKIAASRENGKLGGRPRIYGNILTNRDVIEAKGYVLTQTATGKLVRSEPFKERVYSINGVDCAEMDSRSTASGSILHFFALEEIERNEHGWYIKPTRQARYLWKSWHKNKPEIPRYGYSVLKDEEFYEK